MNKYKVLEGKHDFLPNNHPLFCGYKSEGEFILGSSMWFSREDPDYPFGVDVDDWNKIGGGITWAFTGNANRTCIPVWRPHEEKKNHFEIGAFVNDKKGNFIAKQLFIVEAGKKVEYRLTWLKKVARFQFKVEGQSEWIWQDLALKRPPGWLRFYRPIGAWFGGNRFAHKNMEFLGQFNY